MKKWIFAILLGFFAALSLSAAGLDWYTDYQEAQKVAQAKNLPLYLLFTGSDWCPWCQKLEANVYQQKAFENYAKDHLVLVKLDFPNEIEQSEATKMQNEILNDVYKVNERFPTIVVTNANGDELGRLGYSDLDTHLRALRAIIK